MEQQIAIKIIPLKSVNQEREIGEFQLLEELKKQKCPNIVKLIDFGSYEDNNVGIVMKYYKYGSLRNLISMVKNANTRVPVIV